MCRTREKFIVAEHPLFREGRGWNGDVYLGAAQEGYLHFEELSKSMAVQVCQGSG